MYAQALDLDDLQWERRPFDGPRAYAHAKRAQVALIREWARRIPAGEVTFNAMHPGWADTPGISAALPRFYGLMGPILRTPAEGADTAVWLAADPAPAGISGRLFLDRRVAPVRPRAVRRVRRRPTANASGTSLPSSPGRPVPSPRALDFS